MVAFFLLKRIYDWRRETEPRHLGPARKPLLIPALGLILLFGALLAYQASWQLTGIFRPQFLAFMQSHDRREFNPAHRIQRGRILDRRGQVLAYSEEAEGQVWRLYPFGAAFAHTRRLQRPQVRGHRGRGGGQASTSMAPRRNAWRPGANWAANC